MIVRLGYGVQYNSGVYNSMVKQFAFQPPFAVTQTNRAPDFAAGTLTLQNGFPTATAITNNYGVSKDYRVGYAQTWNLSLQRNLPTQLTMSLDYTGVKGTRLDVLEARTANGFAAVSSLPFTWETSDGNSIAHTGRLQIRRRLQQGFSVGGNLAWQKAIDDASSFGAGAGNVAQNPLNLRSERALSNFDVPWRFNGDYLWNLPFGVNRHWMTSENLFNRYFGDWQLSGTFNFATSTPFTPKIIGTATDIARGTNGTIRPDATGLPVKLAHPTVAEWFNTAAFSKIPPLSGFGNASRNTIFGPPVHQLTMALNKTFVMNDHSMDLRIQANNVFNMPQYQGIDTNVNSPTFGHVISAASMRTVQIVARYRF
jgi:hypothetical protein